MAFQNKNNMSGKTKFVVRPKPKSFLLNQVKDDKTQVKFTKKEISDKEKTSIIKNPKFVKIGK